MLKIYATAHLDEDLKIRSFLDRCFTSLDEAKRFFKLEVDGNWVQETPRWWVSRANRPHVGIMELQLEGFAPAAEDEEGTLRHDFDDGWILDGHGPNAGVRICDLFPELDGKRVRVRVEVLEDNPVYEEGPDDKKG